MPILGLNNILSLSGGADWRMLLNPSGTVEPITQGRIGSGSEVLLQHWLYQKLLPWVDGPQVSE